ncbi:MAG: O-antigen ligase family protein [Anaerolineae bacterium]
MQNYAYNRLQAIFVSDKRWVVALAVVALCLVMGTIGGWLIAYLTPLFTAALVIALVGGLLMLRSTQFGFMALIGIVCLLPFAALPINIGFNPTFLNLVLGVIFVVWLARMVTGQQKEFVTSPLALPIVIFLFLAFVSFVAGLAHASPTPNAVRRFAEIILGIALFFVTVNCVRTREELEQLILIIILAGFGEALIGVVLYFLPQALTVRLLSALRIFNYPAGWGVLRFIRDDPLLPMRAIGTSVDPNILGGLLILVGSLTVPQLFTRRPLFKRLLAVPILAVMGLCLVLTFSRGSMFGLGCALALLGVVKYRRLLPVLTIAGLLILLLPQTQEYVVHFIQGVRIQDLASQMRLGEYKDAFILISRYPWIGVGFIGTPDIDIYLGVSSLYLLIAEEMGLVGLAVFLAIMAIFFRYTWRSWKSMGHDPRLEVLLLGLQTAVVGGLVGGILDHYLFSYPHAVAFFWLYIGLAVAAARLAEARPELEEAV